MFNDSQNEWKSKMTQDPPSLPYQPVQSTLAQPVKENSRLNQISYPIREYVKIPSINFPKISPFTMTMNTRNIKTSRIQSGLIKRGSETGDQLEAFLEQISEKESILDLLNCEIENLLTIVPISKDTEALDEIKEKII
ncbi:hypothetical protein NPIL_272661 [Nephila pilipes]|uniref:Uncharacterized protein n=1 Tax=Nephila pilipes TaxID=299642 RepID=A0A8X6MMQ9_NEPPI|nr:hypothetical protein NPIL_272661 [Nephila pilipes]